VPPLFFAFFSLSIQAVGLHSVMYEHVLTKAHRITLSADMLQQILVERPAVQKALLAYVPQTLK
jgi:hypothetical protein